MKETEFCHNYQTVLKRNETPLERLTAWIVGIWDDGSCALKLFKNELQTVWTHQSECGLNPAVFIPGDTDFKNKEYNFLCRKIFLANTNKNDRSATHTGL